MEELPNSFWKEWEMAVDKKEILKKLPIEELRRKSKSEKEDKILKYSFYSLLNSYFEDLRDYMRRNKNG